MMWMRACMLRVFSPEEIEPEAPEEPKGAKVAPRVRRKGKLHLSTPQHHSNPHTSPPHCETLSSYCGLLYFPLQNHLPNQSKVNSFTLYCIDS